MKAINKKYVCSMLLVLMVSCVQGTGSELEAYVKEWRRRAFGKQVSLLETIKYRWRENLEEKIIVRAREELKNDEFFMSLARSMPADELEHGK